MTRTPLVSLWVMAAVLGAGSALAEQASPLLQTEAPPARVAPASRPRTVSPTKTAQLNAALPKFDSTLPRPETAAVTPPAAQLPDLRETDKPRNTIIRLPDYVVQEQAASVLKERAVETPKARLDQALKRHPGLHLGSFWIFRNDGIALFMHEEEQRLERMKEAQELMTLLPTAEQKKLKPMVDQAFMR